MIDRQYVGSAAISVITAPYHLLVELWCMPRLAIGRDSTIVYIQTDKKRCTLNEGTPIPWESIITLHLNKGDKLWAVTQDHALLGFTARPAREEAEK